MRRHPEVGMDDDCDEFDEIELTTDEIEALEDRRDREAMEDDMLASYHW
jgi:hypothetical protein